MKFIFTVHKNILLVLLLLFSVGSGLMAQTSGFITGVVKDSETGFPVKNVNITVYKSSKGTISAVNGTFKISVSNFPALLQFSHISYYKKTITVGEANAGSITVFLTHRSVNLKETEILGEKYKVFKGVEKEIVDYDFIDTNLIILVRNMKTLQRELIMANDKLDTICKMKVHNIKHPKSIFKDCMGNCHLITNDSAYQIYYDGKSIQLIYAAALDKFRKLLGNCIFETPEYLVFEYNSNRGVDLMYAAHNPIEITKPSKNGNWNQQFYGVDKINHKKMIIDEFNEREKRQMAFEYSKFIFYNQKDTTRYFGDILRFNEMAFFKQAFQAMKYLNDTIYYFNHLKSCINLYSDSLTFIDAIHINYNLKDNWKQTIITDRIKNRAYTLFNFGTKLLLSQINLKTGTTMPVTTIDKLFPDKIKVNNGFLYFLYIDATNEFGKRELYQSQISN